MPRRKRTAINQFDKERRKKPVNADYLIDVDPLTDNQKKLFESYKHKHVVAYGAAGTGKDFYNALQRFGRCS